MKTIKPYIKISTENRNTILQIDTWELYNFIEDYLAEKWNIIPEYFQEIESDKEHTNEKCYLMCFPKETSQNIIEEAIFALSNYELEELVNFQRIQANGKFYCPCCGYNTFADPPTGNYDICRICFWEDDPIQSKDITYANGANQVSLIEGQKNFEEFGACCQEVIAYTRKPQDSDIRNPRWKKALK